MADRIFDEPLRAVHVNATYVAKAGWHLDILISRQGEHWNAAHRGVYSRLSREELLDVIDAELERVLGSA